MLSYSHAHIEGLGEGVKKNKAHEFVRGKSLKEGAREGLKKEWGWIFIKIYYRHVWNFEAMKKLKVKVIFSHKKCHRALTTLWSKSEVQGRRPCLPVTHVVDKVNRTL